MDCCSKSGFLDAENIKNDQLTDIKVTPGDFLPEIGISRTVHHHIEISFLAFLDLTNRGCTMGKKLCHRRLLRNYVIIMSVKMMRIIKVLYQAASRARPFMRWVHPLSVQLCNTTVTIPYKSASNSQSIKCNISNNNETWGNFQLRLSSFPFHFSGKRVCSITLTLKVDFQVRISKYGSN